MSHVFWEYTPEERAIKERCAKCKYSWRPGNDSSLITCDYISKTGKRRGCPIDNCDKFAPIDKAQRRRGWFFYGSKKRPLYP